MVKEPTTQPYCGWCGGKLDWTDTHSLCSQCKTEKYINPTTSNAVFLENNQQIMLLERGIHPKKGSYDLPGGFVDLSDQTVEDSLAREIKEELILEIAPSRLKYLGSRSANTYIYSDVRIYGMVIYYQCQISDSERESIELDHENSSLVWVEPRKALTFELAWTNDREILKEYLK